MTSYYIQDTGDQIDTPINNMPEDNNNNSNNNNADDATIANTNKSHIPYWRSYKFAELLLCFLPVPIGVALEFGTPHERPIPYQSLSSVDEVVLAFVYDNREQNETFSPQLMFACAVVIPFVLQLVLIFANDNCKNKDNNNDLRRRRRRHDEVHKTCCVYLMAIGLTQTLTNAAKLYAGYLRPIFYDLCEPDDGYEECTGEKAHQGRVSFPSGHASMSVCGLLLLSLYLERSYGVTSYENKKKEAALLLSSSSSSSPSASSVNAGNNDNDNSSRIRNDDDDGEQLSDQQRHILPIQFVRVLSVVCYTPMLLAFYIVVSRVHDNFHHPADVVAGALLGGSIASLIFGIWFR